jgi:hypothetical protein
MVFVSIIGFLVKLIIGQFNLQNPLIRLALFVSLFLFFSLCLVDLKPLYHFSGMHET